MNDEYRMKKIIYYFVSCLIFMFYTFYMLIHLLTLKCVRLVRGLN